MSSVSPKPPDTPRMVLLVGDEPYVHFMARNGFMGRMWKASAPHDMDKAKRKIDAAIQMVRTDRAMSAEVGNDVP